MAKAVNPGSAPLRRPNKPPFRPDDVRKKIQASWLVRRLHLHIGGKIELSMSQVRAIDILLKKCIPDLVQTSVTADLTVRYVAELPPMLSRSEWEKKYGVDHLAFEADPQIIDGTVSGEGNGQENGPTKGAAPDKILQ
jgi:hypothetical protein